MRSLIGLALVLPLIAAWGCAHKPVAKEKEIKDLALYYESKVGKPLTLVKKVTGKISIDGKLSEADWKRAEELAFVHLDGSKLEVVEKTSGFLLRDDKNLYIGFRCTTKDTKYLVATCTNRDDDVWQDDSIEIFIDPPHAHTQQFHISINSKGVIQDSKGSGNAADTTWDAEGLEVKAHCEKDVWYVEVKLPFAAVGQKESLSPVWGINLNRVSTLTGEDLAWSPTFSNSSHVIERWGHAVMVDKKK